MQFVVFLIGNVHYSYLSRQGEGVKTYNEALT